MIYLNSFLNGFFSRMRKAVIRKMNFESFVAQPFNFNHFLARWFRMLMMFFGGHDRDSLSDFLVRWIPPNQLRLFVDYDLVAVFAPNVKTQKIKLEIILNNNS